MSCPVVSPRASFASRHVAAGALPAVAPLLGPLPSSERAWMRQAEVLGLSGVRLELLPAHHVARPSPRRQARAQPRLDALLLRAAGRRPHAYPHAYPHAHPRAYPHAYPQSSVILSLGRSALQARGQVPCEAACACAMLSLHERALRLRLDALWLRCEHHRRLPSDRHRRGQRQAGERPSERLAEREARGGHAVRVGGISWGCLCR